MMEKKAIRPIRPTEVGTAKVANTPSEVFEAFNELIAEDYVGGVATVRQDEVIKRIMAKLPDVTRAQVFARGWLNVEVAYREEGWSVTYDKPGYDETYEAFFRFEAK